MEMTLRDVQEAVKMWEEFLKGRAINSANYKMSFLYDDKVVCITEEIFVYKLVFRDYLRPLLIQDEDCNLADYERYFILKLNSSQK